MGTDIHGYIEVKLPWEESWSAAIELFWLYSERDYDAFGCFFGIRNYARFRPIAEYRGLPPDVSPEVKRLAQASEYDHGMTWLSWRDIKQIDWEEEAEDVDERVHEYRRDEQGQLVFHSKAAWSQDFAQKVGYNQCIDGMEQEWDLGEIVYRREKLKRKEVKASWDTTFAVIKELAARYGEDSARLVVWFDS